jgi:hypothetical protein
MAYYQDEYDKRFVNNVNFLMATRQKHKVFKTQLELSNILGLGDKGNVISSIRAGARGVPKDLRQAIDSKLQHLFGIHPGEKKQFLVNEDERPYKKESADPATVSRTQHLSELLEKEEKHNIFLRDVYETNLKTIHFSLETVLVNQKIMLAHISADSVLAARRYVGGDPSQLTDELRERDKLIGAALQKAS